MSRHTPQELRARLSRAKLQLGNMVRRVTIAASSGGAWGLLGYAVPDLRGGNTISNEGEGDEPAENFQGVGIYSRPGAGDDAEALILQVGGEADHPVIAATRNEAARQRYVEEFGDLAAGEIAIFNSSGAARLRITVEGDIEITPAAGREVLISSRTGTPEAFAKLSELNALASHVDGHTHAGLLGGTGSVAALTSPPASAPIGTPDLSPSATGTEVVKGE